MVGVQASLTALMADLQRRVDLAFAELDIVEEMLRPLVAAQNLHQRKDFGARLPITQTKEFQLLEGSSSMAVLIESTIQKGKWHISVGYFCLYYENLMAINSSTYVFKDSFVERLVCCGGCGWIGERLSFGGEEVV